MRAHARQTRGAIYRIARVAGRAWPLLAGGMLLVAAGPPPVAVRAGHPDLSRDDAALMAPGVLGDVLLAPGHPPVVAVELWPDGMAPPPPPGSPIRMRIGLVFAPALDVPSGFCVRRRVIVTTMRPESRKLETVEPRTDYRLPDDGADRCRGARRLFFAPDDADRPRAFAVARIVAAAAQAARRTSPTFPVTVDDQESRDFARLRADHPDLSSTISAPAEITDGRAALVALPVEAIAYVGRLPIEDNMLPPDRLTAASERWSLIVGNDWAVQVQLDGDRIAALALRRRIPPPF